MSCVSNSPDDFRSFAGLQILVTGGSGFVGSHLVRRLAELGAEVTSLGGRQRDAQQQTPGVLYIYDDISTASLASVHGVPQIVFHLAGGSTVADSVNNPTNDFLRTVFSTVLLLDFIRRQWPLAQLAYVSTAAIYGEAEHKTASHDLTCLPISPYGVHKKQVESLLLDHARMYGTRSVIVRPFSVYGPGLRKQLLWDALQKAGRGSFEFFGSGQELRDWVYVDDLVDCLLRVANLADTSVPVFNAGTCRPVSVNEVLTQLFRTAGILHDPVFLGERKEGDPDRLVADDSAEALLGPLFRTPLNDGLLHYVKWYATQEANA